MIPDSGGTWFLPRLVGWQKALSLAMLGDKVSATDAERMGMVYQVYPDDQFSGKVEALAATLASMPTHGLALTKHAFNQSMQASLDEQLALEDRFQQEAALTWDYREGVEAFLQKRPPVFRGE